VTRSPARDHPSDTATLERAHGLANDAVRSVALQRRRLRSTEPEDDEFVMRWWADAQMLIVMLRRLRRAAELAAKVPSARTRMARALDQFDHALPSLRKMRDVGEHIDEYALDEGKDRAISRRSLQVGQWDGTSLCWLGQSLNVDVAMQAAEDLYVSVRDAMRAAGLMG
jgi:hypothetical protein